MIVVATAGLPGSGKDTVIGYLRIRCSIHKVSVGDMVREIAER